MKTKIKILLVIVLAAVLCMGNTITISIGGDTKRTYGKVELVDNFVLMDWEAATKDDGDIEIKYDTTDNGDNQYSVAVTLENMTGDRIDNWEIWIPVNFEIQDIWNAEIIDHYDNDYTIHNAGWNQDIPAGGSVSFGMTVTCSNEVEMPHYVYNTTSIHTVNDTDYTVEFKKHRQKDKKFTGRIIITNQRQERLEDWGIDLDSNFKIVKMQDATLVEKSFEDNYISHVIENPGFHENIEPGESVEFEFSGVCSGKPEILRLKLNEVTSADIDDEDDEDEDDLEYVDEFILDSDYFETREEYEKYLEENGLTDDALIELG